MIAAGQHRIEQAIAERELVAGLLELRPSQRDASSPRGNLPAEYIARRKDRGQ